MAKKTVVSEDESVVVDKKAELEKIIAKKYGKVLFDGSFIRDNPRKLIPTTPTLDLSLRGGIPEGSWNLVAGKPKTGKTTLILQIAANAQVLGRHVYYLNIEHRFGEKNLSTVKHLRTTPDVFTLIQSSKDKILNSQDFLNLASDIIANHEGCVLIIDSISALCSENEMSKDVGDIGRAEGPRLFGNFCRKHASIVPINNVTILGILHLITNTSGYGPTYIMDSGLKLQYAVDTELICKGTTSWDEGSSDDKKKIGQIVDWQIAVSANGPPGEVVKTYLRYGHGYDNTFEIVTLGIDFGLIAKSGAWFEYQPSVGELVRRQGQAKLYEYFVSNPPELELLYNNIKAMAL